MAQLSQLRFKQAGSLRFDKKGTLMGVGPAKVIEPKGNDEAFCAKGPESDSLKSLLFILDRQEYVRNFRAYGQGIWKSLRVFAKWALEHLESPGNKSFSIAHPDFDWQNFLFEEDGALASIIDWDGVAVMPLSIGALRYPKWLVRDWDPKQYNLDLESGELIDPDGRPENNPDELTSYRTMYSQFMEVALSTMPSSGLRSKYLASLTRASLVTGTLQTAASNPGLITGVIENMFFEVMRAEDDLFRKDDWQNPQFQTSIPDHSKSIPDLIDDLRIANAPLPAAKHSRDSVNPCDEFSTLDNLNTKEKQTLNAATYSISSESPHAEPDYVASTYSPPDAPDSKKAKLAKFALGFGERGLRKLAKQFHQKRCPEADVEIDIKPKCEWKSSDNNIETSNESATFGKLVNSASSSVRKVYGAVLRWLFAHMKWISAKVTGNTSVSTEEVVDIEAQNADRFSDIPNFEDQHILAAGPGIEGTTIETRIKTQKNMSAARIEVGAQSSINENLEHQREVSPARKPALHFAKHTEEVTQYSQEGSSGQNKTSVDTPQADIEVVDPSIVAFGPKKDSGKALNLQEAMDWGNLGQKAHSQRIPTVESNLERLVREEQCLNNPWKPVDSPFGHSRGGDKVLADPRNPGQPVEESVKGLQKDNLFNHRAIGQPVSRLTESDTASMEAVEQPVAENSCSVSSVLPDRAIAQHTNGTRACQIAEGKPYPRNKACLCGSRRKFKKCCGKDQAPIQDHSTDDAAGAGPKEGPKTIESISDRNSPALSSSRSDHDNKSSITSFSGSQRVDCDADADGESGVFDGDEEDQDFGSEEGEVGSVEGSKGAREILFDQGLGVEEEMEENLDHGGFTMTEICYALGKGTLDQGRFDRLHRAFVHLLDWTMGGW